MTEALSPYERMMAIEEPEQYQDYTLDELDEMPTLSEGQADDLKIDNGGERIWLSRCGVEDGEPWDNKVTIERLIDGRWTETDWYQAV